MIDEFETAIWAEVKDSRFRLCEILCSSDDFLRLETLDADDWASACSKLRQAQEELAILAERIHRVRQRRLDAPVLEHETEIS